MAGSSRARSALLAAAALCLGLIAALAIGEGLARLMDDSRPSVVLRFPEGNANYAVTRQVPGELVYEMVPGASLGSVEINSLGLRDLARAAQKPPGLRRLLCLGDSITMGMSLGETVPLLQTWPLMLERILDDPQGQRFEVWNAGVSGYNLVQYAAFLERRGADFQPDAILVGLCFNDLATHQVIRKTEEGYLVEFHRREMPVALNLGAGPNRWLLEHSHLWRMLNLRLAEHIEADEGFLDPDGQAGEAALTRIRAVARRLNVPVLALMFPRLEDEGPSTPATDRDHRRVAAAARRQRIPLVELHADFATHPVASLRQHPADRGHPSALGHCLAAIAAYRALASQGVDWIPRDRLDPEICFP